MQQMTLKQSSSFCRGRGREAETMSWTSAVGVGGKLGLGVGPLRWAWAEAGARSCVSAVDVEGKQRLRGVPQIQYPACSKACSN